MPHHRQVPPAHPLAVAPEELAVLPVGEGVDVDRDGVGNRAPEVLPDASVGPGVFADPDGGVKPVEPRGVEEGERERGPVAVGEIHRVGISD